MTITQVILKAHGLKPHHAPVLVGWAGSSGGPGEIIGEGKGDSTIRMLVRKGLLEYTEGISKQGGWWFERARATPAGEAAGEAIRLDILQSGIHGPDFHLFHYSKRHDPQSVLDTLGRFRLQMSRRVYR